MSVVRDAARDLFVKLVIPALITIAFILSLAVLLRELALPFRAVLVVLLLTGLAVFLALYMALVD